MEQFEAEGRPAVTYRLRAPNHCQRRVGATIANLLVAARRAYPHWGARKPLIILTCRHQEIPAWPAPSTAPDLMARRGLVQNRRRHPVHPGGRCGARRPVNDGLQRRVPTGNGRHCCPLTVADHHARLLFSCRALLSTKTVTARPVFECNFREYALPWAIRTDDGDPFATQVLHGFAFLNVWWVRLDIAHHRIHPGCPQENGAHERMHRTLERQAVKPVQKTCPAQQRNLDALRREYNTERPDEPLGQPALASCCHPSPRPLPDRLPPLEYPGLFLVKKITTGATFCFLHRPLPLDNARVDEHIGVEDTEFGVWSTWLGTGLLATFDEHDYIITG